MARIIVALGVFLVMASVAYGMGMPPFTAEASIRLSAESANLVRERGCLERTDILSLSVRYRTLPQGDPIPRTGVTITLSLKGKDAKGSRLVTINLPQLKTSNDGTAQRSISISRIIRLAERRIRTDPFYRGTTFTDDLVNISIITSDTIQRSVRYRPERGLDVPLC